MKNLVKVISAILCFVLLHNAASAQDIRKTTLPAVEATKLMQQPNTTLLITDLAKSGYKATGSVMSEVYSGTDSVGAFQISMVYQDYVSRTATQPVTVGRLEIFRKGKSESVTVLAEDGAGISKAVNNGAVTTRSSGCNQVQCIRAAISAQSSCSNCYNTVISCLNNNRKIFKKISCLFSSAASPCIGCVRNIATLVSCVRNCN